MARGGATVYAAGRTQSTLSETAAIAADQGLRVRGVQTDVSLPEEVGTLASELADASIDILINNAGIAGPVKPLIDIQPDEWDRTFDCNVRGVYLMCRAFLPGMIERGSGDVVNIASVSGKRPLPNRTPYCASKMAVIGLTATLAWEVGTSGVKVNSLSPGPVAGPRIERVIQGAADTSGRSFAEAEADFLSRSALRRMLTADEIAIGVRSILTTPGLTGADIDLSGGMVAR